MSLGKMNAELKDYLFRNLKKVVPIEHRAKFIQGYCIKGIEDLNDFEMAFKIEKDPALKKLLAIKILSKVEDLFDNNENNESKDTYDIGLNIKELREAIGWRLPR